MKKYIEAFIVLVAALVVSAAIFLISGLVFPEKTTEEYKEMVENMENKCGAKHPRGFYCELEEGHEGAHLYCDAKAGNMTREHLWFGDARETPTDSASEQVVADVQLSDCFAGQALVGILESDQWKPVVIQEAVTKDKAVLSIIARSAYDMADAMMAEKKARGK